MKRTQGVPQEAGGPESCRYGICFSAYKSWTPILPGKESTCNAGDPGSIPGPGRSPREGTGYLLQYSWASVVAQTVKNPPAMRETWVHPELRRSPGGGHGNPLQCSCLENPHRQRSLVGYSPWGHKESETLSNFHFTSHFHIMLVTALRVRQLFNLFSDEKTEVWAKCWSEYPVPSKASSNTNITVVITQF